jgi:hypothetical protein
MIARWILKGANLRLDVGKWVNMWWWNGGEDSWVLWGQK